MNNSNYSDTTGNLWFYSEDEAANFNINIADADDFKSFEYKAKFLQNTKADGGNWFLKKHNCYAIEIFQ